MGTRGPSSPEQHRRLVIVVPESTANTVPQMLSDVVPTTNEEMRLNLQPNTA
ncbi:hypothetical protein PGTUg99_007514 [Puccinia graminis f. sp. tritici]|uniref:Uncharacterized protein n=1 Tax=Puccinia graminis f. sp. tritici TaxID=56615 RepID=A0A5B0PIN4_PUCGR|nr:hypothetical protein PGTUg99_007514 [Puccinia graminis f. sp. tritici]